MTKLLFSEEDGRLLGAGIVGAHAGDLIAEAALAIELGADAEDLALTIHPHPTLSETVGMAAEVAHGSITDLRVVAFRNMDESSTMSTWQLMLHLLLTTIDNQSIQFPPDGSSLTP